MMCRFCKYIYKHKKKPPGLLPRMILFIVELFANVYRFSFCNIKP